jgi:hypothetical protein
MTATLLVMSPPDLAPKLIIPLGQNADVLSGAGRAEFASPRCHAGAGRGLPTKGEGDHRNGRRMTSTIWSDDLKDSGDTVSRLSRISGRKVASRSQVVAKPTCPPTPRRLACHGLILSTEKVSGLRVVATGSVRMRSHALRVH